MPQRRDGRSQGGAAPLTEPLLAGASAVRGHVFVLPPPPKRILALIVIQVLPAPAAVPPSCRRHFPWSLRRPPQPQRLPQPQPQQQPFSCLTVGLTSV